MWAIVAIIILGILLMLILRNERRKEILRRQEKERKKQRVREEERNRVEKLAQAGTPELLLNKVRKLEYIEPIPAYLCIKECTDIYGHNGKFELRLTRYWDKFKSAWLVKAEIWFIYPEKKIKQKIYKEDYHLPKGLPLGESTQIFTYTDNPGEAGSGLFYILDKCVKVEGEPEQIRGSIYSGPDIYIRINKPVTQKGE